MIAGIINNIQQQQNKITQSFAKLRNQLTAQHQQMLQMISTAESEMQMQLCHLGNSAQSQITAVLTAQTQQPLTPATPQPTIIQPPALPLMSISHPATTTAPPAHPPYSTVVKQPVAHTSTQQRPKTSVHSQETSTSVKQPVPSTSARQQSKTHTSHHSQRAHPYSATTTNRRQQANPTTVPRPRSQNSAPKMPPVAFISDSTLKAVVEDDATQSTIIVNGWERNLLLFRGKTAAEILTMSKDQLLQLKSSGVKKFIISIGTVDLAQLPHETQTPKEAAESVAASISSLSQHLGTDVKICAIIPAPNSHVSQSAYDRFAQQLEQELSQLPLPFVHAGQTMSQHGAETMFLTYDDVIQTCLRDGIHWTYPVTRTIIEKCLAELNIRCPIIRVQDHLSIFRMAVQKAVRDRCCFKCASPDHRIDSCTASSIQCTLCKRSEHNSNVCGFQWLPCRYCGQVGHNRGDITQCPSYLSATLNSVHVS